MITQLPNLPGWFPNQTCLASVELRLAPTIWFHFGPRRPLEKCTSCQQRRNGTDSIVLTPTKSTCSGAVSLHEAFPTGVSTPRRTTVLCFISAGPCGKKENTRALKPNMRAVTPNGGSSSEKSVHETEGTVK